ncbi:MAG: hypothetical protein H0T63_03680, partial [Pyrinomonadaceae bacterium]|nr:hypothetical protein [Pyrinomonadaceae bacterium]
KDLREIAAILFPLANKLILTRPDNPRAAAIEALARALPDDIPAHQIFQTQDTRMAWRTALEQTLPHGLICVTGSLYLIGEIKNQLADE